MPAADPVFISHGQEPAVMKWLLSIVQKHPQYTSRCINHPHRFIRYPPVCHAMHQVSQPYATRCIGHPQHTSRCIRHCPINFICTGFPPNARGDVLGIPGISARYMCRCITNCWYASRCIKHPADNPQDVLGTPSMPPV